MFNKKNPMRYFSGSTFARLPLYKLAAGGTAVVLTASIGLGAFAASVGPLSAPEPSPTPIVTATPETAATPTPSPTPSPTPEPDKPLTMEASVIQQDVGVTLYVENAPEPSPTPDASASPSPTPSKSAKEDDAENEKTPLLGVAATITLTDAKGNATDYELDTETGTALAEDVTPGDYTLAVQPIEGYTQPEAQTVTVKEKVVYKADVKAVKEKIVQASQVNESAEDSGVSNAGSAPIVNEVTDTVTYADSAKTETGSKTSYTAKLSSSGHLLLADGTETPYLPVYQDGTKDLIGAMRDTSYAANTATAAWLPGAADSVTLLGAANTRMAWVHRADEPVTVQEDTDGAAPTAEETPVPADPTPEPTPEITPDPTPEATPAPTEAPTETPAETQTPAPTAAPTEAPTAAPTQAPTQVPDPTAGWPDNIAVQELANYGFAVTSATTTIYEYTGWQDIDGATYYYDPSTHQPVTGQQVIQGNVYTFAADGALNRTARGIDVSKFQGSIDWNAVKADGITFAIIRCGYRGYGSGALVEDSTYRANIRGAINAGLKVGVYFFSQAVNENEAREEAQGCWYVLNSRKLDYPIYFDSEASGGSNGRADGLGVTDRTKCAIAFCEEVKALGYQPGVYASTLWFRNRLDLSQLSQYPIWNAHYNVASSPIPCQMWQGTCTARIPGYNGQIDVNISYMG